MNKLLVLFLLLTTNVKGQVKGDTLFVPDSIKVISFSGDFRAWKTDSTFIAIPVSPLKIKRRFWYGIGSSRVRITLYTNGTYIETK